MIGLSPDEALDAMMGLRAIGNDELADTLKRKLCEHASHPAMTWEERMRLARTTYEDFRGPTRAAWEAALRIAFRERAPTTD